MDYLYKLLDETTKRELVNNRRISLSRPFFEFKSEGKGVAVFREIEKMIESGAELESIIPTQKVIEKISTWVKDYYNSLPENIRKTYSYNYDISRDLLIAMTIYCQTYCGYFTSDDLFDKEIRKKYLLSNSRVARDKCAYVRIPKENNSLNQLHWVSNSEDYSFSVAPIQLESESNPNSIQATLHIHSVEYCESSDLMNPFIAFNGKDNRRISSLLRYLLNDYCHQNEQRLMLRLPSYRPHESVVGFSNLYTEKDCSSIEEQIFYLLVSIYRQAQNYPKYVYLQITQYECQNLE